MHASPRAVLFDLDGTLLDTLDDLADAMNRVLAARGCPIHDVDAYRRFVGDGVDLLAERALPPERRSAASVADVVSAMRVDYARSWAVKTRPYPGLDAVLDALVARAVPLAVLSNKPHGFTVAMVAHFLCRWPFRSVQGLADDAPRKPDPTSALAIAAGLGVGPASCWFVGDSAVDVETARRAGMTSVGVTWGFRGEDELRAAGATHLARTPAELASILVP